MPEFLDDQSQSNSSSTKLALSDYTNGHRNYVFTRKLILNVIVLVLWVIVHSLSMSNHVLREIRNVNGVKLSQ